MLWDILIAAGIGIIQLVLTWYAVHISVKEHRLRNALMIGVVGLVGVVLTIYGAIRSGTTQQKLETDIAELKKGQQTTNAGIKQIESTPPSLQINIPTAPPQPKPTAKVSLSRVWGIYPRPPFLRANVKAQINLDFVNASGPVADDFRMGGEIYILDQWTEATEKEKVKAFKESFDRKIKNSHGAPLVADGNQIAWFTAEGPVLTQDDLTALTNGKKQLLLMSEVTYRDSTGPHFIQHCQALVPEHILDFAVWQNCFDFHDYK
jgi:hypothetical protein